MKNVAFGIFATLFVPCALACEYPVPTIIPPTSPEGSFQYIYPETGPNYEKIAGSANLAVVKILKVAGEKDYPDVVIVELLHGWGYQSGRYMKYLNPKTSCGSTKVAEVGWYAAVIERGKIANLVPYKNVEPYLKQRGRPEYVYSAIGLRGGSA
ncbi:hypothetical protein [Microbulbifer hydrolyticus]|uniref:Uncharacterized protein n=1 Tax=Microbulbifer hydrolyticus TaxID=48074 RepID=A0A6P1TBF7_9GAMM|nr:hypothetical protein [Microbulbifer hydrolyticus]MBB5213312.1 hypothetical protein [Microbulbifer hydrolyticus]QHQ38609.1 hypothetical protein GTQ55_06145 [Microbulbifer hydrolyticus]